MSAAAASNTSNLTDSPLVMYTGVEKAAIAVTWCAITIPAYAIYCLIALVVYRNKRYHTAGYYLILSLSTSDSLTMSMYVLVGLPMSLLYPEHVLDRATRDIIGTVKAITYATSVFHLFVICINRYFSVVYFARYKQLFPNSRVVAIICFCWFNAVVGTFPFYIGKVAYYWEPMIFGYLFDFTRPWTAYLFRFHQSFACAILISAAYCYSAVILKVRESKKVRVKDTSSGANEKSQVSSGLKEEIRLSAQFGIVTLVFILAYISISVQSELDLSRLSLTGKKWLNAVNSCMWIMNYAVNAFIYFFLNKRMRRDMLQLVYGQKSVLMEVSTVSKASKAL